MPKAAEYPKMVRAGSVAVAVYRVRHKTTSSGWAYTVAWTFAGQRKLRQFGKESDALKEARRVAAKLAHGEAELAEVSKGDYEELSAARQLAGDVPVLAALEEWARARQICAGQLIPAAEARAARRGTSIDIIPVRDAVTRFMDAKVKAGVGVTNSYQKILPSLLLALGERSLHTISSRELTAWMEQRYPHPVSRNTARKRIVALWRWARKQGNVAETALEAGKSPRVIFQHYRELFTKQEGEAWFTLRPAGERSCVLNPFAHVPALAREC